MKFLQWLFELGDLDAYYVPRLQYETLQHELAEAQRRRDEAQHEKQTLAQKNKAMYYTERERDLLRDQINWLEKRNEILSSQNRCWEAKAAQLLGLLEYNKVPGSAYVRMPSPVCSSINQEAVTMLHRRFETAKDAN
ncbi:MAG: hypothetical protein K2W88_00105 [Pararheinheimera sp.]|nr:hypothetical protein [Rheinheimera sp.]